MSNNKKFLINYDTKAPNTKAPNTKAPNTKAPNTKAPNTKAPNTKDKFILRNNINNDNIHGTYILPETKSELIDMESQLKKSSITTKNKTEKILDDNSYGAIFSAGRGFGNLNVANDIRYADSSRLDSKEYREQRETMQTFDYQFSYLDRNFQNPDNIVMPIPRGGESTRKQNQLNIDTMRNPVVNYNISNNIINDKKINFKY